MLTQLIFVGSFLLNLLLVWIAFLGKKFHWYSLPGTLVFILLPFLTVFFDQPRFELDFFWWRIAGVFLILAGASLMAWAKKYMRGSFLLLGTPEKLMVEGPYQFLRHPMYLGLIFVFVGWWWVWAAVYSFYFGMFILALIWVQGYLEEKLILGKKFDQHYKDYRNQTGMFWVK